MVIITVKGIKGSYDIKTRLVKRDTQFVTVFQELHTKNS